MARLTYTRQVILEAPRVGDQFALVETVIAVAAVISGWGLRPEPGRPFRPKPRATLSPRLTSDDAAARVTSVRG